MTALSREVALLADDLFRQLMRDGDFAAGYEKLWFSHYQSADEKLGYRLMSESETAAQDIVNILAEVGNAE